MYKAQESIFARKRDEASFSPGISQCKKGLEKKKRQGTSFANWYFFPAHKTSGQVQERKTKSRERAPR